MADDTVGPPPIGRTTPHDQLPYVMTPKEVAAVLGVSHSTWQRHLRDKIPRAPGCSRLRPRYLKNDVMKFLRALTPDWAQRMAASRGTSGHGLLFTDEAVVYSPGQFVSNITAAMDPAIDASETLGFVMEAMTWVTTVVQTGWLEKFPTLKAAVLESNASWLPLILSRASNFSNLFAFQRNNRAIRDPQEIFQERCFIGFESDETLVYRLWDLFEHIAIWSSDYPHHDAEDAWEGLHHMAEHKVPAAVQKKLLGENARRLYGIEPLMKVRERIEGYAPAILDW
jgi:hypothetical protein